MQNKKGNVAVIAIVIVIVAITAGIVGWMFAKKSETSVSQTPPQQEVDGSQVKNVAEEQKPAVPAQEVVDQSRFNDIDRLCQQNSIQDYGKVDSNKDILVYETECIVKLYPNNGTDSLIRYYVRDADGTFNKKIYSVLNKESFGGGTYGEIKGFQDDKIEIHRVKSGDDSVIVDVYGKNSNLSPDESGNGFSASLSPNKRYLVKIAFSDGSETSEVKTGHIQVKNIENNEVKDYDFSKQGINGVYVAGWSTDGNSVYIAGGIWEFSAPAKLWKIDMANKSVREYDGLDNLVFPVTVFPEENIAFARSGNGFGNGFNEAKNSETKLYQIDLASGSKKVVATESAVSTFNNIAKFGQELFYLTYKEGVDRHLEKLDLGTGKISKVLDGPIEIKNHLPKGQLVLQSNNEYSIFFIDSEKKNLIGNSGEIGMRVPTGSKEYVSGVVGWVKK